MIFRIGLTIVAAVTMQVVTLTVDLAAQEHRPAKSLRESARKILADPEFRHFEHFADGSNRTPTTEAEPAASNGTPPAESNPKGEASTKNSTEASSSEAEPWWKKALNRAQPKGSGTDGNNSRNQRLSPSNSSPSGDPPDSNGSTSTGSASNGRSNGEEEPATNASKNSPAESRDPSSGSRSATTESETSKEMTTKLDGQETAQSGANGPPGKPSRESAKTKPASKTSSAERPTRMQRPGPPTKSGSDGVQRPVRQSSRSAPKPNTTPSDGPAWQGPSLGLGNFLGGLFHGLAYLILAVIVVAIVVLVAQALMHAWNDRQRTSQGVADVVIGPLAHDRSPGETESDVFLREALALAQNGDFRAAIGRLVLGGMSFIERQHWIRYRRGLTVHDYLRVLRSRPEQFAGFREVVHVFEPVEYGRRPATEPLFATALAAYRQGFQTTSAEHRPAT